jgi:DNA-binding PadR family transcriptional regulator
MARAGGLVTVRNRTHRPTSGTALDCVLYRSIQCAAVPPSRVKPHWYYILLALAEGERHGLAIAREVTALSDGGMRLWPAMLYGSLEDLAERGWIEALDDARRRPADESERKRFYKLTRVGRSVLTAETERLSSLVHVARARIKPRAGDTS